MLELWAFADFKFSPLPVPPMFVIIHATLEDRTNKAGHWHCRDAYTMSFPRLSSSRPTSPVGSSSAMTTAEGSAKKRKALRNRRPFRMHADVRRDQSGPLLLLLMNRA